MDARGLSPDDSVLALVYAKQFHHVDSSWWLPFDAHKDEIPEALHELESRNHGQRKALNELIDPFKVDIPE